MTDLTIEEIAVRYGSEPLARALHVQAGASHWRRVEEAEESCGNCRAQATVLMVQLNCKPTREWLALRDLGRWGGHRTDEPHDCLALNCRGMRVEIESLRRVLEDRDVVDQRAVR